MNISDKWKNVYEGYYDSQDLSHKRKIAARQTIDHIKELLPNPHKTLLDIGAGEGPF